MGLFWDLYQQSQISKQWDRASRIEQRVERLEDELRKTQAILHKVIGLLEQQSGQDLDGNGRIG